MSHFSLSFLGGKGSGNANSNSNSNSSGNRPMIRYAAYAVGATEAVDTHGDAMRAGERAVPLRMLRTPSMGFLPVDHADAEGAEAKRAAQTILRRAVEGCDTYTAPTTDPLTLIAPFDLSADAVVALSRTLRRCCYESVPPQARAVVDVLAPAKVFGDLHGQVQDLIEIFRQHGRPCAYRGDVLAINYVFNGDFVDRGPHSLEVVCILFALKLTYGPRITLLRGNHELRSINRDFGFFEECLLRYGQVHGPVVYEEINLVFDYLPLGAVLQALTPQSSSSSSSHRAWRAENRILVLHGGIGSTLKNLDLLRRVSIPFQEPNDRVAENALWNDPPPVSTTRGITENDRGGTTECFGADILVNFCRASKLEAVIRSHECVDKGYEFFAGGLLLTVFSARNYCGTKENHGAIILVTNDLEADASNTAVVGSAGGLLLTPMLIQYSKDDSQYMSLTYSQSISLRPPSPTREEKRHAHVPALVDSLWPKVNQIASSFLQEIRVDGENIREIQACFQQYCYQYGSHEQPDMTIAIFRQFLINERGSRFVQAHADDFFNAFDFDASGSLSVDEFMYGVLAMRADVPHDIANAAGQMRMIFIFRFYNKSRTGFLTPDEVANMVGDVCALDRRATVVDFQAHSRKILGDVFAPSTGRISLSFQQFVETVKRRQISGTSVLFRFLTEN
eukprot:TRINITY_DN4439_c0_g1_i1.p1 TRINITY_DN4439_c0_g1~~TRINITY_DN4439_c0_g1_i1.p1  ORF type:complete len:678 (+),score=131.50 TRINITY_DN4439_c0_g1_i1:54-2087(+)